MAARMPLRLATKFHFLALLALLGGCSDKVEPRLEVWEDGIYQPRALSAYEITGKRDGATTRAVAILTLESGERLRLDLEVAYNPTPALGSGHWSFDGAINSDDGTFKTAEELKKIYAEEHGLMPDDDIVVYCRIGERSNHTWFVLTYLMGYSQVRNYDGSWTEWGNLVDVRIQKP